MRIDNDASPTSYPASAAPDLPPAPRAGRAGAQVSGAATPSRSAALRCSGGGLSEVLGCRASPCTVACQPTAPRGSEREKVSVCGERAAARRAGPGVREPGPPAGAAASAPRRAGAANS